MSKDTMASLPRTFCFVVDSPFSKRDFERFGVEILLKREHPVRILDVSRLLHSVDVAEVQWEGDFQHIDIGSMHQLGQELEHYLPGTVAIFTFGLYRRAIRIYREVGRRKFMIVNLNMAEPQLGTFAERCRSAIRYFVRRVLLRPRTILGVMLESLPPQLLGVRPVDLTFILDGDACTKPRAPFGQVTKLLYAHSLDYDLAKKFPSEPRLLQGRYAVFLDEYLPFHPDYARLGIRSPVRAEDYYPALCRFFKNLERQYGCQVVIAAHPRAQYSEHGKDYFGGRNMFQFKTLSLVKDAEFIICHGSTAMKFAILHKRPLLFALSSKFKAQPELVSHMKSISDFLGAPLVNFDGDNAHAGLGIFVDNEKYENYIGLYIKSRGTPEKNAWEILADYIACQALAPVRH